jgi:hypothetical protein
MTDDLIKRLREKAFRTETYEMLEAAADRIEKLEAALRKYADEEYNGFNACGGHARKALEGKDGE